MRAAFEVVARLVLPGLLLFGCKSKSPPTEAAPAEARHLGRDNQRALSAYERECADQDAGGDQTTGTCADVRKQRRIVGE